MTTALLIASGLLAGGLGGLLGIGGGVVLVPILVLGFGVPIEEAVPATLLCVVASSCAASASYMENELSDVRLALVLELATVSGAIAGGLVAGLLAPAVVAIAFGLFGLFVAIEILRKSGAKAAVQVVPSGEYVPQNYPLGISGSFVAGGLSALLGVGGGPIKVPLMHVGMKVPFKIATATSNLMIGVTGAASVAAYAFHGHLKLGLAAPLVVGVLAGASLGTKLMVKVPVPTLKKLFAAVLLVIAAQMMWKGGVALWPNS